MREFQEKHDFKRRLYSKTSLIILLLVLILLGKGVISVYGKEKSSRRELERVQRDQQELQGRYAGLEERNNWLKTDEGIEAEIRSKFDVAKRGEGVIVVVDKAPAQPAPEDAGIIQKIWNSVKNVFKKEPKSEE